MGAIVKVCEKVRWRLKSNQNLTRKTKMMMRFVLQNVKRRNLPKFLKLEKPLLKMIPKNLKRTKRIKIRQKICLIAFWTSDLSMYRIQRMLLRILQRGDVVNLLKIKNLLAKIPIVKQKNDGQNFQ